MKNKSLLSFIILISCTHYVSAQTPFPETPFNKEFAGVRVLANTRTVKTYDAKGNLQEHNGTVQTQFKHSNNGLSDTITTYSCVIAETIATYSEDGKLVYRKDDDMIETEFIYDSDNRIQSINTTLYGYIGYDKFANGTETTYFDYTQNTIQFKSYRGGNLYKESLTYIQYTDSGYITRINEKETEYVFDSEQRLIRNGNIKYDYFENGYTETNNSTKREYHFLDNGYWSKYLVYTLTNADWKLAETAILTYDDDKPNSNKEIKTNSYKVSTTKGGIIIETELPIQVAIHSLSGQLIKMKRISTGKEVLTISKGIYIVTIGKESHKIIIK